MSTSVTLTIHKCADCPHHRVGPSYSLDGFDRRNDWACAAANGRELAGFVEWPSEGDKIVPPDWCPLRKSTT